MNNKRKDDDLSNNPFVALFPNVEHAKQYVESTRIGLEESRRLTNQTENTPDNKLCKTSESFLDKMSSSDIKRSISSSKDEIINDFLQRVFLITANCDSGHMGLTQFGGVPLRCIKLNNLEQELKDNQKPLLLNMENINQALLERLQMTEPVVQVCIQSNHYGKALNAVMDAREELLVKYLSMCYLRINTEELALKRKVNKDKVFFDELTQITDSCRDLTVSFTGSILLQPEIFPTNNPHIQFFNVFMAITIEPSLKEYLKKIVELYTSEDDLKLLFGPVLDNIWKRSHQLTLLHPDVFTLLEALLFFSQHSILSWIILKSRYWLPRALQPGSQRQTLIGAFFESETLLGMFLQLSSLPKDMNTMPEHFLEPSKQDKAEMEALTDTIHHQLDIIVCKLHEILYNLVQTAETQHAVLYWIGMCLYSNSQRAQMYTNQAITASCGFFLNLTHVLLKFCKPFLTPGSKLLLKVDCRYGAAVVTPESISKPDTPLHLIGLHKQVTMVTKPDHIPPIVADNVKFKFISEMFYLAQQCYKLGVIKSYESYQELMKRLQKLSNLYHDALAQGTVETMMGDLKNNFENGIRIQLAFKAHLLSPSLSDLALQFCVATSYWLIQQNLAGRDFSTTKHRDLKPKYLSREVAPALTVIPEFLPENIGDTVRTMGHFSEETLERCENLQYVMEFFAVFLGNSNRIKNPHLRAKLAESLAAFLPKKDKESNLFSFSFRKRAFEKSMIVPKILPQSLLQLFVDIEFTGHAMEFEQKFTYRHYMYAILECVWTIPAYYANFKKLYEEGKVAYKRDLVFSSFPRFINLLVNDSTFLLDEALQNLAVIKILEKEKEHGEWDNLSVQEKQQKEQNLVQFGHFARGYNTMANETVHVLCYITKSIQRPFASPCMADGMAAFLNYFFVHLVGPKRKTLKVSDFSKYNFEPGRLVKNITMIYLQLGKEDEFCRAIAKDTRSYSSELFKGAVEVLMRLEGGHDMANNLKKLAVRLDTWSCKIADADRNAPEPPDEFIDPISCMLMYEPVKLPSSGKIICKSTIAKHLLSDEKDPFNRSPLRLDQVIICTELQERIRDWMRENNVEEPVYTSSDCGG